jgi:hypothetical protein
LRAEPNDATVDAAFDVLSRYGRFEGPLGPLIAADYARRGALDALERRIDRLAEGAAQKPSTRQALLIAAPDVRDQVIPGMRLQIRLERARSSGRWEPLWDHLVVDGRRVHQALGPRRLSPVELEDLVARQTASLLLDRREESVGKLREVRRVDDLKLGWKLYFAAAFALPHAAHDIRGRLDTLAAAPDANLAENFLDCLTALSALPEPQRRPLLAEIASVRFRLERKLAGEGDMRPVSAAEMKAFRRPRYLKE